MPITRKVTATTTTAAFPQNKNNISIQTHDNNNNTHHAQTLLLNQTASQPATHPIAAKCRRITMSLASLAECELKIVFSKQTTTTTTTQQPQNSLQKASLLQKQRFHRTLSHFVKKYKYIKQKKKK